jgi:hypothetical protein
LSCDSLIPLIFASSYSCTSSSIQVGISNSNSLWSGKIYRSYQVWSEWWECHQRFLH